MKTMKVLLTVIGLFLFLFRAESAIIDVPAGNVSALIAAINAANNNADTENTINLGGGVYLLTNAPFTVTSNSGVFLGPVALPLLEKDKKLTINGGSSGSILRRSLSAPKFRIMHAGNKNEIILNDLTFENADTDFPGAALHLGFLTELTVNNCKFINNQTRSTTPRGGGGIMTTSCCVVKINNSEFRNNRSRTRGAGICILLSDLEVRNSLFYDNIISNAAGPTLGGGIYVDGNKGNDGTTIIEDCVFDGNESLEAGGGVYLFPYNNNSVLVNRCTFRNNKATENIGKGGGLYIGTGVFSSANTVCGFIAPFSDNTAFTVSNCLFDNNLAYRGGGGMLLDGSGSGNNRVFNCTIVRNRASLPNGTQGYGGGIWILADADVEITNCTISENFAGAAGGALYDGDNVTLNNTILAYNVANSNGSTPKIKNNCTQVYTGNHNIEFPNITAHPNDRRCVAGITFIDPMLQPLADNGGPTLTMALLPVSPAIDAGLFGGAPATDQRGNAAVGTRDIGAFEYDASLPSNNTPSNLVATSAGQNQINLTWIDNGGTGFILERSKNNIFNFAMVATIGDNTTAYSDTGLDPNTVYYYRIISTGGNSNEYSNLAGDVTQTANACNDASYLPVLMPNPTIVVGDGTPASCNQGTLQSALSLGGNIMCNCGPNPITIQLTSELTVTQPNTVLDGGGLVTLSGQNMTRILNITEGLDFTLQQINLINGKAPSTGGLFNESGGAILIGSGVTGKGGGTIKIIQVNFENNTITNINSAERGGGAIYSYSLKNLLISSCKFTNNQANVGGAIGGIGSQVTLVNSQFINNKAAGVEGFLSGVGGAIHLDGIDLWDSNEPDNAIDKNHLFTVCGCYFSGNEAKHEGGAIYCVFSDSKKNKVLIDNSSFENNKLVSNTNGNGGAIFIIEDDFANNTNDPAQNLVITNSTFEGNTCKRQGGGLWAIIAGNAGITNCTFDGNSVTTPSGSLGGAIALSSAGYGGNYVFNNCTFAHNQSAHFAGAIFGSADNSIEINNTIFSQNTSDFEWEGHQLAGPASFTGNNNIQYPENRWNGTADNIIPGRISTDDPYLQPIAFNGGFTKTMAIPDSSDAVNAGGASCFAVDQRGLARVGNCDIGAYEFGAVVTGAPVITGFSPPSGNLGITVTISGVGFVVGNSTVFFNGIQAMSVNVLSTNTIEAVVPNLATTGKISVSTASGTGFSTDDFIVVIPLPTLSNFSPATDVAGNIITLTGSNLLSATQITIGGVNAPNFTVVDNNTITVIIPNDAISGKISLTTNGGSVESATNFIVVPTITSFNPALGTIGTEVTITGTNFVGAGGVNSVLFNGTPATGISFINNNTIKATVDAGTTTGKISVVATDGTALSNDDFIIVLPPTIIGFDPVEGVAGSIVKIFGTNLKYTNNISFNGATATNYSVLEDPTADTIYVTVPNNATTGLIQITTPGGSQTTASNFKVLPTIENFTPLSGIAGNTVIINGTNLLGANLAGNYVRFRGDEANGADDVDATVVNVNGLGTTVTVTVPVGTVSGKLEIKATDGIALTDTLFRIISTPAITSFTPNTGTAGTTVIILGSNFTDITSLKIGTIDVVDYTVNTAGTEITLNIPDNVISGTISISNPAGTTTSGSNLTVLPRISGFTPLQAVQGANVVIYGTNFSNVNSVSFYDNADNTTFVVNSPTQITAIVPNPSGITTGKIRVTNTEANFAESDDNFTLISPPSITLINPTSGIIGDLVIITGSNFIAGQTQVSFNGVSAPVVNVISSTEIRVNVPNGATTGNLVITTPGGSASNPFTVIIPAPTITSFSPNEGVPGTNITIIGTNFTGATSVEFIGSSTVSATPNVLNNNTITVVVPASAAIGLNNIRVITPNGDVTSISQFNVLTPTPPPTITSFTPTSGAIGTIITLTGTNFFGTTSITIGGVNAPTYTINNNTKITVTVPSGVTAGSIVVNTPGGTSDSAPQIFTVTSTVAWTGNVSTDWNDPLNWNPNQVPDANNVDVYIPSAPINEPVTGALELDVRNILMDANAQITISSGGKLIVNGTITNAGTIQVNDGGILDINSTITNTGTFIVNGTLEFSGTSLQSIIASITSVKNLRINNPSDVRLLGNLNLSGELEFVNGDLFLNGRVLNFGNTGKISDTFNESETKCIKGSAGSVVVTLTGTSGFLSAGVNIGNLGATITTANPSLTGITIRRGHTQRSGGVNAGIRRYYIITPSGATTGLDATLDFNYFDHELAGIAEASLALFRWNGLDWETRLPNLKDDVANLLRLNNINQFSEWTAGSEGLPLPVNLIDWKANRVSKDEVILSWKTISESQNKGFEVEASSDGVSFEPIAFLDGAGNSQQTNVYQFRDYSTLQRYYRLGIIAYNDSKSFSKIIFVEGDNSADFLSIFPNPTQESIKINLDNVDLEETMVLNVTDIQGNRLLVQEGKLKEIETNLNIHLKGWTSGMYVISIKKANQLFKAKLLKQK